MFGTNTVSLVCPPPSTSIYLQLPPSTSIHLHLPPSTSIHLHLPPSTSIYLHPPPSTSSYLHLPPFTSIYLHPPPFTSIHLRDHNFLLKLWQRRDSFKVVYPTMTPWDSEFIFIIPFFLIWVMNQHVRGCEVEGLKCLK